MRCEELQDCLIDIRVEALATEDLAIREHLRRCASCRESVDRARRAWDLLASVPDEEPDSHAMRQRFAAMLSEHRPRTVWPWFGWRPLYEVAAVLIALAGGVAIGRHWPAGQRLDAGDVVEMRHQLRDVRQMLSLSLMQQAIASERIKGVMTAARIADPPSDIVAALLDTLLHDPSVNVRLACIRALQQFGNRPEVRAGVLHAVAREPSPLVNLALIELIVEGGDPTGLDVLRLVSQDEKRDQPVRAAAADAVERLLRGGRQ